MKIYFTLFSVLIFFNSVFGQDGPKILLTEGEIRDSTVAMVNGHNFGFRVDWGQGDNDTSKYEFSHARGAVPFFWSSGKLIGKSPEFRVCDIRGIMPGDRLVFNLELNGKKFSRSYHVLSTKASETKPWFFNIYFIWNGDTLNTDAYEILFNYPKDTITVKYGIPLVHYSQSKDVEKHLRFIKYFFLDGAELPESILIKYNKHSLTYDFIASRFFHGDILISYKERKKRPRTQRFDANAEIKFVDSDSGGGLSSRSYK